MHASGGIKVFCTIFKACRINLLQRHLTYSNKRWLQSSACAQNVAVPEPVVKLPPASPELKEFDPKLHRIVDDIARLTLIEVADLNKLLKLTLNIPDAPMMQMAAMPAAGGGAPAAAPEEEEETKAVKSEYKVKLIKYDETKKVALIKEIKQLVEGMNLVQAKKFVESVPQVIQSGLSKDEAEKLKKKLEELGGAAELE